MTIIDKKMFPLFSLSYSGIWNIRYICNASMFYSQENYCCIIGDIDTITNDVTINEDDDNVNKSTYDASAPHSPHFIF